MTNKASEDVQPIVKKCNDCFEKAPYARPDDAGVTIVLNVTC